MLLLALACRPGAPPAPAQTTVTGPGYQLTVPANVEEVLRSGLRIDLADLDGSPTVRIDEPSRLPLAPEALLEDPVRFEQPDDLTALAVGTERGRTIIAVLKAAAPDGPFIQATCTGNPEDAALLESICSSLTLSPPAPAARHDLPGLPLTIEAPHPPQPDGEHRWQLAPENHELSAMEITCRRLERAPSEEQLAALVSPHGEPAVIRLPDGLAVLTEDASGITDAVAEIGDAAGSWQCRCSSADHIWRQRQALGLCLSLKAK